MRAAIAHWNAGPPRRPGAHRPLPTGLAEALHLRLAREAPAAVQAEQVPNALRPPIAQQRHGSLLPPGHGAHG